VLQMRVESSNVALANAQDAIRNSEGRMRGLERQKACCPASCLYSLPVTPPRCRFSIPWACFPPAAATVGAIMPGPAPVCDMHKQDCSETPPTYTGP
jgi:hypothetical protein